MSLFPLTLLSPTAARGSVFHAATDLVRTAAQEWRLRRASQALQTLDDSALHDIGVARGDIDAAVRHGRAGLSA